jgi:hypothetical protein
LHIIPCRRRRKKVKGQKEKESKKRKKLRNKGILREILKNGVVGDSKKCDFIGLMCFWGKNGGKN